MLEIENEIEEVSFEQSIEEVIEEINDDIELIVEDNASIESIQKDNEEINGLIIKTDTDDDNQINEERKGIFYLLKLIFIKIYLSSFSFLSRYSKFLLHFCFIFYFYLI